MSHTGDILEDTGECVGAILKGSIARYKCVRGAGLQGPMDLEGFIEGMVFEVLCALHNHADKGLIEKVLMERIHS